MMITTDFFRRKMEMRGFLFSLVVFFSCISTSDAIRCYACGEEAEFPFIEEHYNETFITKNIQNSCEEFDRIPPNEKQKYEIECPGGYQGCMVKVGASGAMRTCSKYAIDDCKPVNEDYFCYCNRQLCNGMNAESIVENTPEPNRIVRDDFDEDDGDEDEGSGSDEDEDDNYANNYRTTSRKIDSVETSTTEGNKFAILSVPATQPTINKAVNSHLSRNLLIFLLVARFSIVSTK